MRLRAIGKKADLSLSINAIVILILAITMLGLGLAFLRGTFKKTTEQFAEVSGTVKEQIVDEIKSKNEKLFIRGTPELDIRKGETKEVYYGIKNVLPEDETTFTISASCTEALLADSDPSALELTTFSTRLIKSGEFAILPLRVKSSPDTKPDTYSCFMNVVNGGNYARSDFFIKVAP